jgi:hypothetical protein
MSMISVICATALKPNPGMASVDLAFHALSRRHQLADEINFCQLYTSDEVHRRRNPGHYHEIQQREQLPFAYSSFYESLDKISDSDWIVYWGDFLHMAHYQRDVAAQLVKLGLASDMAAGLQAAYRHFLLAEAPTSVLQKTVTFGGNLLFNSIADYQQEPYGGLVRRFMGEVHAVWMRDLFSAHTAAAMRGVQATGESCLGVDCSMLLREEDLGGLPRPVTADQNLGRDTVAVFFDRTEYSRRRLLAFADSLCRRLDLHGKWLPWRMCKPLSLGERLAAPRIAPADYPQAPSPGDLYELIRRAPLVITDTYHLCVNAWRLGTPAVCIGQTWADVPWDVSSGAAGAWRDKRWIFYAMHDAMPYYVHVGELGHGSACRRRVELLAELLGNAGLGRQVTAAMTASRDVAEERLVNILKKQEGKA